VDLLELKAGMRRIVAEQAVRLLRGGLESRSATRAALVPLHECLERSRVLMATRSLLDQFVV
jgi:hypothetical protein